MLLFSTYLLRSGSVVLGHGATAAGVGQDEEEDPDPDPDPHLSADLFTHLHGLGTPQRLHLSGES